MFFFFKQKTAYEMRISDWSSDVCSSDLQSPLGIEYRIAQECRYAAAGLLQLIGGCRKLLCKVPIRLWLEPRCIAKHIGRLDRRNMRGPTIPSTHRRRQVGHQLRVSVIGIFHDDHAGFSCNGRSEEHTYELKSLM